jgi:hypothetical protein
MTYKFNDMKKYLSFVWLLGPAVAAASCEKDIPDDNPDTGHRVVISAQIDEGTVSCARTRSADELRLEGYSLRYLLEVWTDNDEGDNERVLREEMLPTTASNRVSFDFSLPEAGDYRALLWADYVIEEAFLAGKLDKDLYYQTGSARGLKNVSLIASTYAVNTPSRDAFFGRVDFTKTEGTPAAIGSITAPLTLSRPFGRMNVIEKNAVPLAKLTAMSLSYDVPKAFNVEDGTVSETTIKAKVEGISVFPSPARDTANLFYDYIFAPAGDALQLGEITVDYTLDGAARKFPIPAGVPIERNRRTNVMGNILFDDTAAGVEVEVGDASWKNDPDIEHYTVAVGDYAYEGEVFSSFWSTDLPCLGVVFRVDEGGKHGLIVSREEVDLNFASAQSWCAARGEGWHLPAIDELKTLYEVWNSNREAFDRILIAAGGAPPTADGKYLSTKENMFGIFVWSFDSGSETSLSKMIPGKVRAVRAF